MKILKITSIFLISVIILITAGCDEKGEEDNNTLLFILLSDTRPKQNWVRDSANPVVSHGGSITNIGDPSVIYDADRFRMWASCVEADVTIAHVCYSESTDGSSWTAPVKVFSPAAGGSWDEQKVEIPTVIRDDTEADSARRYKMWYGGADSANPTHTKIGYAHSADGSSWTRVSSGDSPHGQAGLVMIPGATVGDAGVVSDPTALKLNGTYHLWYNSFGSDNDILISHATSTDGANWSKSSGNPVMIPTLTWEEGGPGTITRDVSHPTVMWHQQSGSFLMWYGSFDSTANETYTGIGFAVSADGNSWIKDSRNPLVLPSTSSTGEQTGLSTGPCVVYHGGKYHLFYAGADAGARRVINHAVSD